MVLLDKLRLKSGDPQVRRTALEHLAASGTSQAVELLVTSLGDSDPGVRHTAAIAFCTLTDERALSGLMCALMDASPEVREAAAAALGRQGNPMAVTPLSHALRDAKARVRTAAASSLRKLGWSPPRDEDRALLENACGEPARAGNTGDVTVARLVTSKDHDTSFERRAAAEALKGSKDPRATGFLVNAAKFDADLSVRVAALDGLSGVESSVAVPALEQALRHTDHRVRLTAAETLALRNDPQHCPVFIELLQDKHFEVRQTAIKFLARFPDPAVAPALTPLLQDADPDVREVAARSLGVLHHVPAIEGLVLALIDEERPVRMAAERSLNEIDPQWMSTEAAQHARPRIEKSTRDERSWIRSAAVVVLAKLQGALGQVPAPAG